MDEPRDLDFRLLGSFEAVTRTGARVKFANRKVAQLAALLALRPGVPRDRGWLASAVWPDSDPDTGLASLRNALAVLKKDISEVGGSDHVVEADRTRLCFNSSLVGSDVERFLGRLAAAKRASTARDRTCELEQAVASYGGPLLPETDAAWADQERVSLSHLGEEAVSQLVSLYTEAGRAADAADVALNSATSDSENETKLQIAIKALTQSARGAEAVGLYRRFERSLRERLGVSPSPATVALARNAKGRARGLKEAPPSNLPQILAPFFGRNETLTEITRLVGPGSPEPRVVTLLGTGGIGKTRLAVEVSRAIQESYHGAVWMVELAAVTDPLDIVIKVVQALDLATESTPDREALANAVGGRPCLFVMDNLEQIGPGLAAVVADLLTACPGAKVLATSREPIGVPGEFVERLDPLPVPVQADSVLDSPSVQLFLERARQAAPRLQEEDPAVLSALVHRLEGMPLAICLAAAQANLLTPAQILSQLEDRFGLLATENPEWPERHRRLWACIDWSYRLHPEAQGLLKRLSWFRNGWTVQTAQWACPEVSVHALLQTVVRSSLVFEQSRKGQVRFEMFESIREFLRALSLPEETAEARRHHANAVRQWLQFAKEKGQSFNTGYIEERASEYENFRAAFEWGLEHEPELSLSIANSLAYYWFSRDMGREGLEWLNTAIGAVPNEPGELLAMSYRAVSTLHICVNEYEPAYQALQKGVTLLPEDAEPTQLARFFNSMGNALMRMGRFNEALEQFQKGIELFDVSGDQNIGNAIKGNIGFVHYFAGNLDEAERVLSEAVKELEDGDNNDWLANFLHNSGLVAKARGDYELAHRRFVRARSLIDDSVINPAERSWLNDAAVVAVRQGRLEEALDFVRKSAAGVGKSKGLEQQAECLEAAAEYCEAAGNPEEAVALLAVILRLDCPPQRSLADCSPTAVERFERIRKVLAPDRFKSASTRYKGSSLRDVLEEVEDLAKPI